MGLKEKVEANISNGLIERSLDSNGTFTDYFNERYVKITEQVQKSNIDANARNPNIALFTKEEIKTESDKRLHTEAERIKTDLRAAVKGDTGTVENMDIQQIGGMASAATGAVNAVSRGGFFGYLSAITGLAGAFGWFRDLINTGIRYLGRQDKSQTWDDISTELKMEKGVAAVAKKYNVDPETLMKELAANPPKAPATPGTPATTPPVPDVPKENVLHPGTGAENVETPPTSSPPASTGTTKPQSPQPPAQGAAPATGY